MRGSRALVICPKLPAEKSPTGLLNCAWLKTLKNSARKSSERRSVKCAVLLSDTSQFSRPGPWKKRRLASPGTQSSIPEKTFVEKYWKFDELRGLRNVIGWPLQLGRFTELSPCPSQAHKD